MKSIYLCLVLAAAIQATLGLNNKLYGRFSLTYKDPERKESFFEIPRLLSNATGWTKDAPFGEDPSKTVYCRNGDYHVCAIFDPKGSIAGLQISMSVADFEKSGGPVGKNLVRKTVAGTEVYSKIFVFPLKGAEQTEGRLISEDTLTAPNGVQFFDDQNVPYTMELTEEANKGNLFLKQNCIPNMGRHYFFNLTKATASCEDVDKSFALYNEQTHEIVGGGIIFFGKSTPLEPGRQWMEYPPRVISLYIAPRAPLCVHWNALRYGLTSFHFYVTEEPWTLTC